jgi:hypothetical protein
MRAFASISEAGEIMGAMGHAKFYEEIVIGKWAIFPAAYLIVVFLHFSHQ